MSNSNIKLIVLLLLSIVIFTFGYYIKIENAEELRNVNEIDFFISDSISKDYTSGRNPKKYYRFQNNNYLFYYDDLTFSGHDYIDSTHQFNDKVLLKTIEIQNSGRKRIISMKINNKQLIEENHIRGEIASDNNFTILISMAVLGGALIWYFRD